MERELATFGTGHNSLLGETPSRSPAGTANQLRHTPPPRRHLDGHPRLRRWHGSRRHHRGWDQRDWNTEELRGAED